MFRCTSEAGALRLEFSTELANIDRAMVELERFLAKSHPGIKTFGVNLVCREAVNNALQHGNRMQPELPVVFSAFIDGNALRIVVEDRGEGWDWASQSSDLPDMESESGRGLFLMSSYARSLDYNERGNRLSILMDICSGNRCGRRDQTERLSSSPELAG